MKKQGWYYTVEKEKTGPISHQELPDKLDNGGISDSTNIWTDELTGWLPISEVKHCNMTTFDETTTIIIEKRRGWFGEANEDYTQPRPWVRFWARMIDYSLFIFVIGLVIRWFHLAVSLLAIWGDMPRKWLLKVMVRNENHRTLSFSEGVSRSCSVGHFEMGVGLPIISLITMIIARIKLQRSATTTWDQRGKYIVCHGCIGIIRCLIVFLYFLWCVWMMVRGQSK